jgi:hypothetical protein
MSERGLMWDEKFGFRPRHSTPLQLDRPVERITRNFGEKKRLTGAVFLDVEKPSILSGSMAPLQINAPKFPVLHSLYDLILPSTANTQAIPNTHFGRLRSMCFFRNRAKSKLHVMEIAIM